MSAYTIIVPDTEILQRLCGTNDSNLKLIESFLGSAVFACGNELSVETENPEVEQQFRFIIDSVLDEFSDGNSVLSDAELFHSILNDEECQKSSFPHYKGKFFSKNSIQIPGGTKKIYPRTRGQSDLLCAMRENDMVFALGPAGSGKTFLVVAEALRLLFSHQVKNIVLTRPVVEAGENLGFLPGDLSEKINPYIRPLYDSINLLLPKETVRRITESGVVEAAPLAYMRGRTLNESAVILDEAQNTTREQMKMFLTRMGENSKVFITGDTTQIDLPKKTPSGLIHAVSILKDVSGISIVELSAEDVVRNKLVKKIIKAYENEEFE